MPSRGWRREKLLDAILAEVEDLDNPYDVASTMVDYLQSSANPKYDADIRDRLRGPVRRRVLRPVPPGLPPVLRVDDGNPAP